MNAQSRPGRQQALNVSAATLILIHVAKRFGVQLDAQDAASIIVGVIAAWHALATVLERRGNDAHPN